MALRITHVKIATKPDQPGAEINKNEWNDAHTVTGQLDSISTAGIVSGAISALAVSTVTVTAVQLIGNLSSGMVTAAGVSSAFVTAGTVSSVAISNSQTVTSRGFAAVQTVTSLGIAVTNTITSARIVATVNISGAGIIASGTITGNAVTVTNTLSAVGVFASGNITANSVVVNTALSLLSTGGAPTVGTAVLVAGTVTVNTTAATATCKIFFQRVSTGGTIGFATTYTISNGVSFTINSDSGLDTSTYNWLIVEAR